jgi:hypothetical protein
MHFGDAIAALMSGKKVTLPVMCSQGTFPRDWWLRLSKDSLGKPCIEEHKAFRAGGPVTVNYIPDPCIGSLWTTLSFGLLSNEWEVLE